MTEEDFTEICADMTRGENKCGNNEGRWPEYEARPPATCTCLHRIVSFLVSAALCSAPCGAVAFEIGHIVPYYYFDTVQEASASSQWRVENGPTQQDCTVGHVPHPNPNPTPPGWCALGEGCYRVEVGRWQLANAQGQICQNNYNDYYKFVFTCPPGTYADLDGELNGYGYGCVATPPSCPVGKHYDETLGRCLSARNNGAPLCE